MIFINHPMYIQFFNKRRVQNSLSYFYHTCPIIIEYGRPQKSRHRASRIIIIAATEMVVCNILIFNHQFLLIFTQPVISMKTIFVGIIVTIKTGIQPRIFQYKLPFVIHQNIKSVFLYYNTRLICFISPAKIPETRILYIVQRKRIISGQTYQ